MFGRKRQDAAHLTYDSHLHRGVRFEGAMSFSGNFFFDGTFVGTIRSDKQGSSTLVLGPKAVVKGDIIATNLHVYGRVEGKLRISSELHLMDKSHMIGDIYYSKLRVQHGARIDGKFHHQGAEGG